jgi:hypothetical protein
MDTDTPETDAQVTDFKYAECEGEELGVDDEFARRLERERNKARLEAQAFRDLCQCSKWPKHRFSWE